MCGFVLSNIGSHNFERAIRFVARRGPDLAAKIHYRGLVCFHSLLSLTDKFTPQPFISKCGMRLCMFNGEIYNAQKLGAKDGDGSILLPLYERDGPEFARQLDGEFSIVIVDFDRERITTCTDTFATKPLWFGCSTQGFAIASYESALLGLGINKPVKQEANSILVFSLAGCELIERHELTTFSLDQHKMTFDDWTKAFRDSVSKRAKSSKGLFVALSSGYDSGAIACELWRQQIPFLPISISGKEDLNVLRQRHELLNRGVLISPNPDVIAESERFLKLNCEPFQYSFFISGTTVRRQSVFSDRASVGLALVCQTARANDLRVGLSGQGVDEIISDYGFGGRRISPHSTFGGLFPETLADIFPWPSFFGASQYSYLGKEECVMGTYGIEGRYPFLDPALVQEFLWLHPTLKNSRYKAPLANYLEECRFPFFEGRKIGFALK
jgi:asparagine synthetase B (glutamine-hydrolysing)